MNPPSPWYRGDTILAVLARCSPEGRGIAERCRLRILDLVPHAVERLRPGWGLIGYDAPHYFAFLDAGPASVRLGFEWGVQLPDPEGILEGSGRRVRLRTLRTVEDVENPALAALILQAADIAPGANRGAGRTTRRTR